MDQTRNLLEISPSLVYSTPASMVSGNISFVSFKPLNGSTFAANQSATIRANSSSEFVNFQRSYLKYDIATTNGTAGATAISAIGGSCVFSSVAETVSGVQLPIINNHGIVKMVEIKLATGERKTYLKRTELADDAASLNIVGVTTKTICTPLIGQLASSTQHFPLAFCNGGVEWQLTFAPTNDVYSAAKPTAYVISNLEIVLCMVAPPPNYLQELSVSLSNGGQIKIPLACKKVISTVLTATTPQSVKLQTGFLKSINSVTAVQRDATKVTSATTAKDSFSANSLLNDASYGLSYYSIAVNSTVYPRNKQIKVLGDPENLMQTLAGFDTSTSVLTCPATTDDILYYSWKSNGSFGAGIPSSDGFIEYQLTHLAAPAADRWDVIVEYDAMLVIESGAVSVVV